MKIFSHRNLKLAAVALGILAVIFAFRPSETKVAKIAPTNFVPISIRSTPRTLQTSETPPLETASLKPAQIEQSFETPALETITQRLPSLEHNSIVPPAVSANYPATTDVETAFPPSISDSVEPSKDDSPDLNAVALDSPASDFELSLETDATPDAAPNADSEKGFELAASTAIEAQPVDYVEPVAAATGSSVMYTVPLNDAAAQKAVHHIEYGKSLARRNATEAAGQEFLGALRVLAESNDTAIGENHHTGALRNGLLAIREATDFKTDDPHRQLVMNVASIIEGHETRLIGDHEAQNMTASAAMRRYFDYAGQQLGKCGGQNAAAAEALYCLGKMRTIASNNNPDPESIVTYEAIIFHHASLAADPNNFRSANELGVLLAKNGHLEAAETYLKNSLRINPIPQTWANLAKVHTRKGTPQDQQLANLAVQEYQVALSQPPQSVIQGPIQWVEPQEFIARSPAQMFNSSESVANADVATPQVVPVANLQPSGNAPSFVQRIGSLFVPKNTNR